MAKILFVCTGNIFRSMSAEMALKSLLPPGSDIEVASAGTNGRPDHPMRDDVRERLGHWGVDPTGHVPRLLTQEILDDADLVIAMGTDHRDFIVGKFGTKPVLFLEVSHGRDEGVPDLWEVVPDYLNNPEASRAYVEQTIDSIFGSMEALLRNLPFFLKTENKGPKPPPPPPSGKPPQPRGP